MREQKIKKIIRYPFKLMYFLFLIPVFPFVWLLDDNTKLKDFWDIKKLLKR